MNAVDAQALRIEGLHKSFGSLEVLRGIDLERRRARGRLPDRLVGERQVDAPALHQPPRADRRRPDRRRGRRDHRAAGVDVDRIRRRIGIVFQAFNLFPHMCVLDNVTLAPRKVLGRRRAEAEAAATALLERFGLADKRTRLPGPAVGRPAAARRDRPGARDAARPAAPRRGHERPRPGARGRGPRRHPRAGRRRDDDGHRDPRDGLRPRHREPGLLPRRGPDPRGRARRPRSSARRARSGRGSSSSG